MNILSELNINSATTGRVLEKINFVEGELRCDDLLARLELIRTSFLEQRNDYPLHTNANEGTTPNGILHVNSAANMASSAASTSSTIMDPWKRTISQLSMASILEPELTCRVEIQVGPIEGGLLDRHRTFQISLNAAVHQQQQQKEQQTPGTIFRRYRDFDDPGSAGRIIRGRRFFGIEAERIGRIHVSVDKPSRSSKGSAHRAILDGR